MVRAIHFGNINLSQIHPKGSPCIWKPRMSSQFFNVKEHILPCSYIREYPEATLDSQEDTLKLHIKQYIPLDRNALRPNAVTIIGTHANGFPKVRGEESRHARQR